MKGPCAVLSLAFLFLASSANRAEEKAAPKDDKDFLSRAAEAGNAEVKLSELAETRASNEKVKEFARKMVRDHKEMNAQLAQYAKNLKVAVLAGLDRPTREAHERLSQLKGAEFDRSYMEQMVRDHEKAVKLFEGQAKSSGNGDLKTFAEKSLPAIREHLKEARSILGSL